MNESQQPDQFKNDLFLTDEFRQFAERNRSSWGFFTYLWTCVKQWIREKS